MYELNDQHSSLLLDGNSSSGDAVNISQVYQKQQQNQNQCQQMLEDISEVKVNGEESLLPEQDDLIIKAQLVDKPSILSTAHVQDTQPCTQQSILALRAEKIEQEDPYKNETEEERQKRKSKMYYDALMSISMDSLVFKIDHSQQQGANQQNGGGMSLFTMSDANSKYGGVSL